LKLGIWKESLKNKSVEEFFFKLQNGGLNQDGVNNHYFFSFGFHTFISQMIVKSKHIFWAN
jgi:hypothetical protein